MSSIVAISEGLKCEKARALDPRTRGINVPMEFRHLAMNSSSAAHALGGCRSADMCMLTLATSQGRWEIRNYPPRDFVSSIPYLSND